MPTPLPILPTPSQQAGAARSTEWGTLFIGLALGGILTCVVAIAGCCGGWYGWRRSHAKARRRAALDHELRPPLYPGYFEFLAGERPVSPISPARASTAIGDQYGPFQGQQGLATTQVAEPEVARRRTFRGFLNNLSDVRRGRRRSIPEEMIVRRSLQLAPLEVRIDVAGDTGASSLYESTNV